MEVGKLTVQRRHQSGKGIARKLRAQGVIPGVCYGHALDQPVPISVNLRSLRDSLDPERRQNTVITVSVEDNGQVERSFDVMLRDVQLHKLHRAPIHVDMVAIDRDKEVVLEIPLTFTGKPKGLILGGVPHVVRRQINVRCKPADIPTQITVDITNLDINDVIHVSDLIMPTDVVAESSGQFAIITCTAGEVEAKTEEGEEAS